MTRIFYLPNSNLSSDHKAHSFLLDHKAQILDQKAFVARGTFERVWVGLTPDLSGTVYFSSTSIFKIFKLTLNKYYFFQ